MWDQPVTVAVAAGVIGIALELCGLLTRLKSLRLISYGFSFVLTMFAVTVILGTNLVPITALIAVVALYRSINAFRVLGGRIKEPRLYHATKRTSLYLVSLQLAAVLMWQLIATYKVTATQQLYALTIVSFIVAIFLLFTTLRNLKKTKVRVSDMTNDPVDLPTVSVCIPARNETRDLPSCLGSIIRSDYPKLEILVLDDCSQDKTSEIIKGFAQDGVRFIKGNQPKDNWLAKNQAYQVLAEAASGEVLLFCGVDTRFEPEAIRAMIDSLISRKKQMISLLPRGLQDKEHASLVQPMRYWWELALPRRLFNRPPVLSTVWMITRQALFGLGEIHAVKNSVLPEAYFARELTKSDEYSFMRASGKLMISTAKRFEDQLQTAVRTHYPRMRKRPENILLLTLAEIWLFGLPLSLFVIGFFIDLGLLWIIAGVTTILLGFIHHRIMSAWLGSGSSMALALFPVAVAVDLCILQLSMYKYEFSTVAWKDRNICIPVMRYHKSLPQLE